MNSRSLKRILLAVLVASIACSGCTSTKYYAADISDVRPGDRVRVRTDAGTERGAVTACDSTVLVLDTGGSSAHPLELGAVNGMERHVGTTRHGGVGLAVGAGVGLAVGLVVGMAREVNDGLEPLRGREPSGVNGETSVLVGVLVGGLVGFAIGQGAATEHWQPIRSERFRFGVEPTRDGARAALLWEMRE